MSMQTKYATDLTDPQWELLEPLLPPRQWRWGDNGRPPCSRRQVLNGILYVTKTGCQWRMLPPEFGRWKTVYGYFHRWSGTGCWQQIMETLTHRERQRQGRKPQPSAGSVDSQSVKTATQKQAKGYDAGKRVHGRKRHALVDTLGLLIRVLVTPADTTAREGLMGVLSAYFASGVQRLKKLWVDGSYRGDSLKEWVAALKQSHKIDLEVVEKQGTGFAVLPRRWVVERTFAWRLNYRRHAKDYEGVPRHSEALIHIAMIHLLLKRYTRICRF